jgi:hypothetical protein
VAWLLLIHMWRGLVVYACVHTCMRNPENMTADVAVIWSPWMVVILRNNADTWVASSDDIFVQPSPDPKP